MQKCRKYEYDFMRLLLLCLVVLGHSCYNSLFYGVGGVDYTGLFISGEYTYHSLWTKVWFIHDLIYSFHMPAFFALSGSVYYITKQRYSGINELIAVKAKKLLCPFLFCAVFYTIPVKLFGGFYVTENIGAALNGILFASGDAGHLWFLAALFWNFVIIRCLEIKFNAENRNEYMIPLISVILYILLYDKAVKIPYLDLRYFGYFSMGYLFAAVKEKGKRISDRTVFLSIIFFIPACRILPINSEILSLAGVFFTYVIGYAFERKAGKAVKVRLVKLLKYSFPIYLFHDPVNILVLKWIDYFRMYDLYESAAGILLLVAVRTVIPAAASVLLWKALSAAAAGRRTGTEEKPEEDKQRDERKRKHEDGF